MPGRTTIDADDARREARSRDGAGTIPYEAFVFMGAVSLVFLYGFWLRLSGPPASPAERARLETGRGAAWVQSGSDAGRFPSAGEADPHGPETPVLPEQTIAGSGLGDDPLPPVDGSGPGAPAARALPPEDAPRGAAPASAQRRARALLSRREYRGAADAFAQWARTAPAGSWTVQIGVLPRLDSPADDRALSAISTRSDLFILPPGTLPKGYAPVCEGIYPSEEAARRAARTLAPLPGASGSPIPKRLDRLAGG